MPTRGASAVKLAKAIRRTLLRGPLHGARRGPTRPLAFSITLTCRSGHELELRASLAEFLRVVVRRAPRAGLLCALDRAQETGRWHVHALALLPADLDPKTLVIWWTRCWRDRESRPVRGAQHINKLAPEGGRLAKQLDYVLIHHLARTRKKGGEPIAGLPALPDRVVACGALAGVWSRVCTSKGIRVAPSKPPSRKGPSRPKKASTVSSRPQRTWALGVSCPWCGVPLPTGKRRDARYCGPCCGHPASRALRAFEKRVGRHMASAARGLVEKLDGQGWLRRDAIHAAAKAFRIAGEKGVPVTKMKIETPKCSCGKPLPDRANAATCGDSKCRMKLHRRRLRVERVRARVQDLFSRLLAERHRPFTADHARALGAGLRLRPRAVNKLLRELVEDGNASVGTDSADVYLLAPPHVHLAA